MKFWCVSDLHVNHKENAAFIDALSSSSSYKDDVLLLAGDVCENFNLLRTTLKQFKACFRKVFYCVGNHELYITKDDREQGRGTSLEKLKAIHSMCTELGVSWQPEMVDNKYFIVPLLSWYHFSWDRTPDPPLKDIRRRKPDYHPDDYKSCSDAFMCKFTDSAPVGSDALAKLFDDMNPESISVPDGNHIVITMSHFLPLIDLLPAKSKLHHPFLPKIVGSACLYQRVATLQPALHVFGHSHIDFDKTIAKTRYVQNAFGTPRERKMFGLSPPTLKSVEL